MKKLKSIVSLALCLMLASLSLFCFSGCDYELKLVKKPKKYDVSIMVGCRCEYCRNEYVFTPDIDEMEVEMQYDGHEHHFTALQYQLVDHPEYVDKWLRSGIWGSGYTFSVSRNYIDDQGVSQDVLKVKERGRYIFSIRPYEEYDSWNYRVVHFVLIVK